MITLTKTETNCTYISSGDYSTTYSKNNAFDLNYATSWISTNISGKYIGIQFNKSKKITHYGIKIKEFGSFTIANNAPISWQLQILENGTWISYHTVNNYNNFKDGVESFFKLTNPIIAKDFRIYITANNGSYVMISDFFLYEDVDRIDTDKTNNPNIIYSSSGDYSSTYSKDNIFNGTMTKKWISTITTSTTPKWIQIILPQQSFPYKYKVSSYGYQVGDTDLYRTPKNWKFQASTDNGNSWIDLDIRNNYSITQWSAMGKELIFNIENPIYATHYRLYITETNGSGVASCLNLFLYDKNNIGNLYKVKQILSSPTTIRNCIYWKPENQLTYDKLQIIRGVNEYDFVIKEFSYSERNSYSSYVDFDFEPNSGYDATYSIRLTNCSDGLNHSGIKLRPERIVSVTMQQFDCGILPVYEISMPIVISHDGNVEETLSNEIKTIELTTPSGTEEKRILFSEIYEDIERKAEKKFAIISTILKNLHELRSNVEKDN